MTAHLLFHVHPCGYSKSMSFHVTTVNVNGIRAAVKERSEDNKGFIPWLEETNPDVVLLQEVRASEKDTEKALQIISIVP